MSGGSRTVVHAYGLIDAAEHPPLPERGIAHTRLRLFPFNTLSAVVGDLPAETFGEGEWARRGLCPRWVAPAATAHHAALQQSVEQGAVLPFGRPRISRDGRALLVALEAGRGYLARAWWFLVGHVEWSVQVFATAPPKVEEDR